MERDEFLCRYEEAKAAKAKKLGRKKLSDSEVSRAAGLGRDYIRNQRRKPDNQPIASYLVKLAEWLEQPAAYFVDKSVHYETADRREIVNPERRRLAQQVAEEALQNHPPKRRERLSAQITQELYDVLTDYEENAGPVDREIAVRLLRSTVNRMVLSRLKFRK